MSRGLGFTTNYTFGKPIDDASDSGVDKFVSNVGRVDGQVSLGGTRNGDRSVSTFSKRMPGTRRLSTIFPSEGGINCWAPG